jgi:F-type H+-transporting ATPase subunit b
MKIELAQVIFQIINFGVVLGALTYLLYKPILKILDERAAKIAEANKQAEVALAEKGSLEDLKKKTKLEADKQASQLIEKAKQTAQEQADHIITEAKQKAEEMITKQQASLKKQQASLEESMKTEFNDAVMAVTEKVLGSVLDKKSQSKLIDDEIAAILKSL